MQLVGADPEPLVTGVDELTSQSNYLIGNNRQQWHTRIPHYRKVRYEKVYPGVDLVYYGRQSQLEYDFVVSPGADPRAIKLSFTGPLEVRLGAEGELLLNISDSEIRQIKPVIYQEVAGIRKEIAGGYRIDNQGDVSFEVGDYDVTRPLVIDPVLLYSTYLGGTADDLGLVIAVDMDGSTYVAGVTTSLNFPTTPAAFQPAFAGGDTDVFVTKLNRTGTELIYSTYLGGSGLEGTVSAVGLAVDKNGNAYVTGNTTSTDFPTTPGVFQPAFAGGPSDTPLDTFVTKLNHTGTALIYSTYLGGSDGFDVGFAIAADKEGNAYVTGATNSTNFPTTRDAFQPSFAGGFADTFVTKLNRKGTALLYSTYLGGSSSFDAGHDIAVDNAGNAYVFGPTGSADFPTTPGAFQPAFAGGSSDVFVTKLNGTGTALVYSTYLGGSGFDFSFVNGIAVDENGNAYAGGQTDSPDFPTTPGAFQPAFAGGSSDVFVTKLNRTGTALVYSTYLGGSGFDGSNGIAVDENGHAYAAGLTDSPNFPTTPDAFQPAFAGGGDVFVTKLNRSGTDLIYSTYLGGSGFDESNGIAVDKNGSAHVIGDTDSPDFPTTPGTFQPAFAGSLDAFVAKIGRDDDKHDNDGHDNRDDDRDDR
jgi:hypothetical protein